jgi:hypothetical protein
MTGSPTKHSPQYWIGRALEAWEAAQETEDAETKLELEMFACPYEELGRAVRRAAFVSGPRSKMPLMSVAV